MRGRITRDAEYLAGIAGNIAATGFRKWQNEGVASTYSRYFHTTQAFAAIPAVWSNAASGRQSMVTKPRVCSIRRSHARIAGNVARS